MRNRFKCDKCGVNLEMEKEEREYWEYLGFYDVRQWHKCPYENESK